MTWFDRWLFGLTEKQIDTIAFNVSSALVAVVMGLVYFVAMTLFGQPLALPLSIVFALGWFVGRTGVKR